MRAGVILESEDLHRNVYNDSFEHFDIKHQGKEELVSWSVPFYDMLSRPLGQRKPETLAGPMDV